MIIAATFALALLALTHANDDVKSRGVNGDHRGKTRAVYFVKIPSLYCCYNVLG